MTDSASSPIRYCPECPLPAYSYVPGLFPHPISNPAGHSFGQTQTAATPLVAENWAANETWLYALDLFNHGYYWEAHETWESLWHASGRKGPIADFLKGLIKLAAAGVKAREGRLEGVRRHARRAAELLRSIDVYKGGRRFGVILSRLIATAEATERRAAELIDTSAEPVVRVLPQIILGEGESSA